MNRDVLVQIFGFGFVVLIVIVFFFFLFSRTPAPRDDVQTQQTTNKQLQDNTDSAKVTLTTDGEINGNDQHRQIRVSVDKNTRTLEIVQGYQNTILNSYSFPNNNEAFRAFLSALQVAGFSTEKVNARVKNPEGQCAEGVRYFMDGTGIEGFPENLWSSSCGNQIGTFGGNLGDVRELFQAQIPGYSQLTQNVDLN